MKIEEVRINGIKNPIGFRMDGVSVSWRVRDSLGKKAVHTKIEIIEEASGKTVSEKEGEALFQGGEQMDVSLTPKTRYLVKVSVKDDTGAEGCSEGAWFETGLMNEKFRADWIAAKKEEHFHPVFRKKFSVSGKVKKARLYASGAGLFEAYINGKRTDEEYLKPYLTNYEKCMQIITIPVEEMLREGENELSFLLGKGWYMGIYGLDNKENHFGSRMAVIGELMICYEDGREEYVLTDGDFYYQPSVVWESGIYFGETIDRTKASSEDGWKKVEVLTEPEKEEETKNLVKSHLKDRLSLPVYVKETLYACEQIHTPAGETVIDFGQNFAGFPEMDIPELPKGTKLVFEFGEILQQGNFYRGNYRDAHSTFTYISDGVARTVRPHFTFFGFRYVRVSGFPDGMMPEKEAFRGCVIYSDLERTGEIRTSHGKINRLFENTVWGLKSNFIDIPTDCPQRSERLAWTGDAQVFAPTAAYHMDTRAFFHKFIQDLMDEQEFTGGAVPNFLPNFGHGTDAASVWGDIGCFLPMTQYKQYGDASELAFSYPLMKGWVDYMDSLDEAQKEKSGKKKYTFCTEGFQFSDWLALDGPTETSFKGSTDDQYVGAVYYHQSVKLLKEAAEILGKKEDAAYYGELAKKSRENILNEYFTPNGRLAVDTQASYVIALKFGLYHEKERLVSQFKERLKKDGYKIRCGFVGAPLLCTVLAECGLTQLAYDFLLKEGFPGWLYCVNLGATTVWERWNSVGEDGTISDTGMNSLNHYSYGSVMEFMYAYAAGIRAGEAGYRRAVITPHPDVRIPRLFCRYRSAAGEYVSSFCIKPDGVLDVHIEIPFGCTALVTLPEYDGPELELEAGSYDYHYMPGKDFRKRYDEYTPIVELGEDERAAGILFAEVPPIGGMAKGKDPEFGYHGLDDFRSLSFLPFEKGKLERAIDEVSELVTPVDSLYDAVIFDLDGVICSTDRYHYEAWKELADGLGIPFDLTINDRLRGVSRMDSLEIILENSEKEYSKEEKEAFAEQKNETYKKLLSNMSEEDLSDEVRRTLDELRNRGKKLAIGSSSKNTPFILGQIGLGEYFDKVSDGNGITHSKPHPEVFLRAAELLGIRPERCLVMEDAVSGAAAGHAAGMYVACVGSAAEERAGDYNMESFSELLNIVE